MSRVLGIPDLHCPVTHPAALAFCQDLYAQWDCDEVVFIGDVVDWHAISFHTRHPQAPGPKQEYELALENVQKWVTAFPKAKICIGNHDERPQRLAATVNIPELFLVDYKTMWKSPGWDWKFDHVIDDVYYFHGTGNGGVHPAFNVMKKMAMSVVMGHCHSAGGTRQMQNPSRRFHCMDTGCLVDDHAFAFAYGKHTKIKSCLSAGVVIDGIPYHEPLRCGRGEPYHRSKFIKSRKARAWAKRIVASR